MSETKISDIQKNINKLVKFINNAEYNTIYDTDENSCGYLEIFPREHDFIPQQILSQTLKTIKIKGILINKNSITLIIPLYK